MVGRPREFDRDEALDQAMNLFWSNGYESTGVAEICEHLGVGRQSLYNAFGDKESLFGEALERYDRIAIQALIDRLEAPGSGLDAVNAVLDLWEEGDGEKGCLMANSIAEFGMRAPRLSGRLAVMLGRLESALHAALVRAQEAGELPEERDPRTLARLLTTVGQGLSAVGRLDPTGAFSRDTIASARTLLG